jgi:rhodanese-related sulfurtransferase
MLEALKKILGIAPIVDFAVLVREGAIIIDVRTKGEYAGGNIRGSVNIPLDKIDANIGKLKNKNQAIITCCASGSRSGLAQSGLKSRGYTNVYNGGSWFSLDRKLR